ncbi:MAG: chromosomal replication initiator protein DnaA [Acidimicrobiia bacterium]|nr:chromosomal replication initiator protein DnaA [Acidimicrobiia bacterium]
MRLVDDAELLWKQCADILREQVSEAVWLTSFNAVRPLRIEDGLFVLGVPSAVFKDRIESRYLTLVESTLRDASIEDLTLRIEVRAPNAEATQAAAETPESRDERARSEAGTEPTSSQPAAPPSPGGNGSSAATHAASAASTSQSHPGNGAAVGINPRYTFDAFVTGTSNRFAHAAALSVAETPARSYNPLFIYGQAGLGKTHLLQAIGHYVAENYPGYVVRYVTTEAFLNEYVDTIRTGEWANFKKRYRDVNVLLLDDIQFIEGREGLQEEFFHTFNHLHQANSQVVLSSDRPPDAIATLEDRLRSRFKMGLTTEVNPPDLETRLAILRKKSESERQPPPPDVLEFIATNITNNIRELEGALIRVCAYASLTKEQLSTELAERVLADLITDSRPRPITPESILNATEAMFGFSVEEIQSKSRRRPLVQARQISMYVFRQLTDMSYPAIAREFGGRDHTTVIHAVEKVEGLMKERRQVYDQVTELTQMIRNGG